MTSTLPSGVYLVPPMMSSMLVVYGSIKILPKLFILKTVLIKVLIPYSEGLKD